MVKQVEQDNKWWFQGKLSDSDFARVGEVWDKQDIYSKASRKYWIFQIWIPRLIVYCFVALLLSFCAFGYAYYHNTTKPSPVFLYEGVRGDLHCVRTFVKSGGTGLTSAQMAFCKDLERKK